MTPREFWLVYDAKYREYEATLRAHGKLTKSDYKELAAELEVKRAEYD